MIFPYQRYAAAPTPSIASGVLCRPEIPLTITGPHGSITVLALVDTGADETIVPFSVAAELSISLDNSDTVHAVGFGGTRVPMAYGTTHFEIRDDEVAYRWSASVAFCDTESEAIILGHAGCLEFMQAAFDGAEQFVELRPTPKSMGVRVWL